MLYDLFMSVQVCSEEKRSLPNGQSTVYRHIRCAGQSDESRLNSSQSEVSTSPIIVSIEEESKFARPERAIPMLRRIKFRMSH